jgi:hypothetical protein
MLGEPSGDPGRFFLFCARGPDMPDRSDEFRRAARECLQRARAATDEGTRLSLLINGSAVVRSRERTAEPGRAGHGGAGVQRAADDSEPCDAATAASPTEEAAIGDTPARVPEPGLSGMGALRRQAASFSLCPGLAKLGLGLVERRRRAVRHARPRRHDDGDRPTGPPCGVRQRRMQ